MGKIVGFPDPVNETSARVVAGGVVAMASTAVVLDQPWVMFPLVYGFAARVIAGPTLSPLGQLATRLVTPRLPVAPRYVPGPPKRLAQAMGLTVSGAALVAHYGFRRPSLAKALLGGLIGAAGLEAFAGYCIACRIFPFLQRIGVLHADACEACADLWGKRQSRRADGA